MPKPNFGALRLGEETCLPTEAVGPKSAGPGESLPKKWLPSRASFEAREKAALGHDGLLEVTCRPCEERTL